MPHSQIVTFRDTINSRVADFLADEKIECVKSQQILCALIGLLVNYKEEGIEFSPPVVLCEQMTKFSTSLPGIVSIYVGEIDYNEKLPARILKDVAVLARDSWAIFVERPNDNRVRYGVFSYPQLPTSLTLDEAVEIDPDLGGVYLRKTNSNSIVMKGSRGFGLKVIFSTTRDSHDEDMEGVKLFSELCTRNVSEGEKTALQKYFTRVLQTCMERSHGTILVAIESGSNLPPELADAVILAPKIAFSELLLNYRSTESSDAVVRLAMSETILQGFMASDGVVIFDTTASVIAYRGFYKDAKSVASAQAIVGGARRRAFEGLKQLVGTSIAGVLFRSQDGLTLLDRTVQ